MMRSLGFPLAALAVAAVFFAGAHFLRSDYFFYAGYTVIQFVVLASAWNILGGYVGYVNFGAAAFLSIGAYTGVALEKLAPLPLPVLMLAGGLVSGIVGLGVGYLTLRLRGIFFAIATFAVAVVAETLITNWDFVGGSAGVYVLRPKHIAILGSYIEYMFLLMLILAVIVISASRAIERSRIGMAFAAIRDDEVAAEATGVPTLRLKLLATVLSGAFMGMAGAPLPYYVTFLEPSSAFSLSYAVNTIAMPLVGGTAVWFGPVIGAILLGTAQQVATVTISSEVNLLIVGCLLVGFVVLAPNGIAGLLLAGRGRTPR
jgi:branched-chain amino acid transport system permease protein